MSAIAGIAQPNQKRKVQRMLQKMAHRGPAGNEVKEINGVTLGVAWTESQIGAVDELKKHSIARDFAGESHFASAQAAPDSLTLKRDPLGVAPLYYGKTKDGSLCFASEVKALLEVTKHIEELPPGTSMKNGKSKPYFRLEKKEPLQESPEIVTAELRKRLNNSVKKCIKSDRIGSWLSGGLDSSTMAALAKSHVKNLYTFAVGYSGAPDLKYAKILAENIDSKHYELVVSNDEILKILPDVIYNLESFDALLVRSSITNYMVARLASDYVPAVFSGEGGDELFAGYHYIKALDPDSLADELIDITGRLHNTALQRVDRSASGNGTVAHVGFLDNDVVDYALRIPTNYKLHNGVEKWILRQAVADKLPEPILKRTKAKFWDGAGVQDHLEQIAEEKVSDRDFNNERVLSIGWKLNTKEELFYYRIFKEYFASLDDLSWMGRTKGAPVVN
jgi:asparagine synthase (glutamine-hydrolysing)